MISGDHRMNIQRKRLVRHANDIDKPFNFNAMLSVWPLQLSIGLFTVSRNTVGLMWNWTRQFWPENMSLVRSVYHTNCKQGLRMIFNDTPCKARVPRRNLNFPGVRKCIKECLVINFILIECRSNYMTTLNTLRNIVLMLFELKERKAKIIQ